MFINLLEDCCCAYCVFSRQKQENHGLGEVFDERPDWQQLQQKETRKAMKGRGHLGTVLLSWPKWVTPAPWRRKTIAF
jgi:hypothetical protein